MSEANIKKILSNTADLKTRFIGDYKELKKIVDTFKKIGYRIVLTQGVYDLIHEGHAAYLEKARSYGDLLIVGVDSDELTKQRKGPNRPIVPQQERMKMLVHLRHVDIVTIREAHHKIGDLIRLVKPDVLIVSKSTSDFTNKMVNEYTPYCKKIVSLMPQATTSTSARVRNLTLEGAEKLAGEISKLTENFIFKIRQA
ncbi:MAG: adenylyltransferase/cytidyltransferase family protein [Candidatus Pacebacteria bacterium]|nr:adenylyltransferase/cytidyltransferase family protein [Candidatus Paceibacterota bacterium]MDD5356926.1 adenylyltransferase/cytidyltransferase family protein [Candidatus Paceibacterota bacterium]